ncbi:MULTISPECIES: lysozyme inhibitor LprI family protein [Cylindrospermopsis]|jgi:uncharacterized protein YecT (DUF1311 family)|uniref:Lysozyme inhibitor LprI family protein n=1 Tax=Cylindrospermopsis curvispora GIHE-G1 TaxID=2666332 RepID=A0A7H0F146_9CYAN|nr:MULTISPECIES: lysozyme inhibitor LprI family protein [Cylindrospermopsis]QNP29762.1 lysozyme inhibitor LprI family protein [Cylindrospermopsis curvispora GIHE-G1]TPX27143.1 lysozyme inhibitor LprI family protein [Cylindrospermopsis raciborskii GIHE 2018]
MKKPFIYIIMIVTGMLGSSALLLEPKLTAIAQSPNCVNRITQYDMNLCASLDAKVADGKLNQIYKQVRVRYNANPEAKLLIDAQKAWIKYRDASCAFSRGRFQGGSIVPMVYHGCLERLTKERTKELESYLQEGSFSKR